MVNLTEQQLSEYIQCPAKFDIVYNKKIEIEEPINLTKLLSKAIKFFYVNLFNEKVISLNELKSKWDSICRMHPTYIDADKNIKGWSMLTNVYNWAAENKIYIADIDTSYKIVYQDVALTGNMEPILVTKNKKYEILYTNFANRVPDQMSLDMNLKLTINSCAFKEVHRKEIEGVKIYVAKNNSIMLSKRSAVDYRRLESTVKAVAESVKHNIYYPRESTLCQGCAARPYCRYWHQES